MLRTRRTSRGPAAASACAAGAVLAALVGCGDPAPPTGPARGPAARATRDAGARAADARAAGAPARLLASALAPGKCLDVAGGRVADGAAVILWPCHGGANQRFAATAEGTLVVRDDGADGGPPRCLDAAGGALRDGDPFIVWPCHGGPNQRWALAPDGTLRGAGGRCVDLPAFATGDGTRPVVWSCNAGANQRWQARARCAPGAAPAGARVLVFTRTTGFRHDAIPAAVAAVTALGERHGFAAEHTEDPAAFADATLAGYAAVVFLLTTGDVLGPAEQAAMERYVRAGGGFVGVHSAADTEYDWPWYGGLVGAYFRTHGPVEPAVVSVSDAGHESTRCLPDAWTRTDEWYEFQGPPAAGATVLAAVDAPAPHPIAWHRAYDGGRAWYTGMGHTPESYADPEFLAHLAGGIVWAATR